MEKRRNLKILFYAALELTAFVVWTLLVKNVGVQSVGANGTNIGFATLNTSVHKLLGVHLALYDITDWLSLVPICFIVGFAVYGLFQLIKRKSIKKVDADILILGGSYVVVMAVFVFFENFVINYRPVLINGVLEASYPSSTTILVMCVMPTAMMVINKRVKNPVLQKIIFYALTIFTVFMVVARLISGVHWISDIIGGALLSAGMVMAFYSMTKTVEQSS